METLSKEAHKLIKQFIELRKSNDRGRISYDEHSQLTNIDRWCPPNSI